MPLFAKSDCYSTPATTLIRLWLLSMNQDCSAVTLTLMVWWHIGLCTTGGYNSWDQTSQLARPCNTHSCTLIWISKNRRGQWQQLWFMTLLHINIWDNWITLEYIDFFDVHCTHHCMLKLQLYNKVYMVLSNKGGQLDNNNFCFNCLHYSLDWLSLNENFCSLVTITRLHTIKKGFFGGGGLKKGETEFYDMIQCCIQETIRKPAAEGECCCLSCFKDQVSRPDGSRWATWQLPQETATARGQL